jgi:hypothetical protein
VALLFFFRLVMPHMNHRAADHPSGKQNQGSVGINSQSLREFLEVLTLSVLSA